MSVATAPVKKHRPTTLVPVGHASMQFSDDPDQMEHDAEVIFARAELKQLGWITGTEAGGGSPLAGILKKAAARHGFKFWKAKGQDAWIAVRKSLIKGGWSTYWSGPIVDGVAGKYTDKGVISVTFEATGNLGRITVIACHYLTKGRPDASLPEYRQFVEQNRKLARAIGAHAREMGKGSAIVFYGGDQNIVDRDGDTFFGEPLTSVQDELEKWENTGHGDIDVIASYDRDGRVKAISIRVFTDKEMHLFMDHYYLEAVFEIGELVLAA